MGEVREAIPSDAPGMNCQRCGEPLIGAERFCSACGGAISQATDRAPDPNPVRDHSPGSYTTEHPESAAVSTPKHDHGFLVRRWYLVAAAVAAVIVVSGVVASVVQRDQPSNRKSKSPEQQYGQQVLVVDIAIVGVLRALSDTSLSAVDQQRLLLQLETYAQQFVDLTAPPCLRDEQQYVVAAGNHYIAAAKAMLKGIASGDPYNPGNYSPPRRGGG
jgi:hypothetical protein